MEANIAVKYKKGMFANSVHLFVVVRLAKVIAVEMKVVVWTFCLSVCWSLAFCSRVQFVPGDEKMSWEDAIEYCNKLGRMLAEPRNQVINDGISMRARAQVVISNDKDWNRIWTGVNRRNRPGTDEFMFGYYNYTFDYRNFDAQTDRTMDGDCVEIYLRDHNTFRPNWALDDCDVKKHFLCSM